MKEREELIAESSIFRAITIAEDVGGYVPSFANDTESEFVIYGWYRFILDSLFWSSLGKSLGWNDGRAWYQDSDWGYDWGCEDCKKRGEDSMEDMTARGIVMTGEGIVHKGCPAPKMYIRKWKLLIDHLASGGDPESFFAELLDNNKNT